MKQYLVSKDVVDAFLDGSWDDLADFQADDSWGSNEIVELPPNARVLTRGQVQTVMLSYYKDPEIVEDILDELFDEEVGE